LGVIPARLGSERLPQKPLRLLGGRPLIAWVTRNAVASGAAERWVVASDSPSVIEAAAECGVSGVVSRAVHDSGTSRVAEVAALPEFDGYDVVLNVQGDEPFVPAEALAGAIRAVVSGRDVGTAAAPLGPEEAASPDVVKVVMDESGRALYFSRSVIPHRRRGGEGQGRALRGGGGGGGGAAQGGAGPGGGHGAYWQHLGVYAYRPDALQRWVRFPPTALERSEKLEQLRALGHGLTVGVACLKTPAPPGIDSEEDLRRAETYLTSRSDLTWG
jgi:3-deoxy-manno-octulosonate cytidylyltransferase (CMP-KDO synthetase)